jgi:hypothetical protein
MRRRNAPGAQCAPASSKMGSGGHVLRSAPPFSNIPSQCSTPLPLTGVRLWHNHHFQRGCPEKMLTCGDKFTCAHCPRNYLSCLPQPTSHRRTVLSSDPLTSSCASVGLNWTQRTEPLPFSQVSAFGNCSTTPRQEFMQVQTCTQRTDHCHFF